ncbi:FGGY family carbohydrate kinase [Kutzneria sp. CA-103260]|uniref:FGGY family carbohydrate kinase n=1 Tax=Kutzneria sp. CA-103260 TaxID=2802641 RepID=UPI001BA4419E|nr:FGGY family carbohydrate kinase [Kutzneria sp. CA-103260]QUQ67338.1 Xylulose kinase [Kutzneria sp. CA-103260]
MTAAGAVFGVEVGADSVRVAVLGDQLAVLDHVQLRYPRGTLDPYAALDVVFAAIDRCVQLCATRQLPVRGMALAGSGDTLVGLDELDRPMTPVFTGPDPQTRALARRIGPELRHATGVSAHGGSPLVRLAWFAEHGPDLLTRVARWCELKDFVLSRLTARVLADTSCASAGGLLAVAEPEWSAKALELAGIGTAQLPPLVDPTDQVPLVTEAAQLLALPALLPLVVGAAGLPLAALGMGVTDAGTAVLWLGSRLVLAVLSPRPVSDDVLFTQRLADGVWAVGVDLTDGQSPPAVRIDGLGRLLVAAGDALTAAGAPISRVRVDPAVLKVPMAAEVVAAALGVPVEIAPDEPPAAVGAALLAARSLGFASCIRSAARTRPAVRTVAPDPRLSAADVERLSGTTR